ncbi:hypothetical protein BASA50_006222 [Batrachochytrium salamandrivorans]|uniref:Uncharacterized protein n=1 Tax=Batrachochytrium salamandrivorans TaxID=1357716 RepID=A0ABQ8FAP1_9FUNG|nr:hypothetical protein BASA60_009834 [Batrachochytrium salamandrivorans]KAH6594960.1 hypothetical protein BASA50_006222 [Batrachochytrium salamandrivorans]KAH9263929.1 hypothetical protein BASA83_012635 [Batrachochytrium salamandrivorans]
MKLISFAALSFLAITVSAFPPHTDTKDVDQSSNDAIQDVNQSQGATPQSEEHSDKNEAQARFDKPMDPYEGKDDVPSILQTITKRKKEKLKSGFELQGLVAQLRKIEIGADGEPELNEQYAKTSKALGEASENLLTELTSLKKVPKGGNGAKIPPKALDGN